MDTQEPQKEKETQLTLPAAVLLAGILISGTIFLTNYRVGTKEPAAIGNTGAAKAKVSTDNDPDLGSKDAKVTVIEFSDFQCPYCRRFAEETFLQLKKEYIDTGKVRWVFRDFPLAFHSAAEPSAQGGGCANDQGMFWEYHDKLFSEQAKSGTGTVQYGAAEIKKWAQEAGLDSAKFNNCLDSGKYKSEVAKDLADGSAAGVTGTPAFFVNGKLIVGAQQLSAFETVINEELK